MDPARPATARDDPVDEQWLVEGMAAGHHDALTVFLERTHDPVYWMAARLTPARDVRTEWAHDALLGIIEDLRRGRFAYTRPGSFWAWFRKRAYFRILDRYRAARQRGDREVAEPEALATVATGVNAPDTELERVELRSALEGCLDALSNDDHRRALWHLLVDDLPYADIAARLDTPLNTVRAWIRRGRTAVRECLAQRLGLELP